ncbi:MAG: DinB family protein [Candidatus Rokuibacteriota bacterium]
MDAISFFLVRYGAIHRPLIDDLLVKLPEMQVRTRPHPGVNTVAWLVWHTARVEDVGVNRFLADRPQVFAEGWRERLGVARRDVGTGMNDAEVDDLSAKVDLQALRGYLEAVTERTLAVVETLRGAELEAPVAAERVRRAVAEDSAVAPGAEWLTDFWAAGRSRAWFLAQVPLLHVYGHWFDARVTAGLWGARSP